MKETKEIRYFPIENVRAESDQKGNKKISGYAAVFEKFSQVIYNFKEKIAKGAFAETINGGDVRALWSHNTDLVLGRTRAGTLRLKEDDYGLFFELDLPDTSTGNDAFTLIKRGDVTGMSFGFSVEKESWEQGKEGNPHVRTLEKVALFEVSPTAFPAYEATSVQARDLSQLVKEVEVEWAEKMKQQNDSTTKPIGDLVRQINLLEKGLVINF